LSEPTKSAAVKLAVRKIHRKLGTHFKQAYPVTSTVLQQLLAACEKDLRGLRNRALLWLAYDSMRRRSELVSLRIEDIELNENHLLSVRLRKSKTDQTGSGYWIHLGKEASKAVLNWLDAAKLKDGFIVRGIDPMGSVNEQLGVGQVGRIFKRLARCAQLNDEAVKGISGHSMRVGSAQDLLIRGASLPQLMVKGGWSKTDTVIRYVGRVRSQAIMSTRI
jgi:integrase